MDIKINQPLTANDIFEEYKYFVGTYDIDSNIITKERLMAWAEDPKRELVCIFCGNEPRNMNGYTICPLCRGYKGIIPNCPNL